MIWLLIAVMTAAAVLAVLWPLARRARDLRSASDVAVYKDQLEEIERDQGFGLIAPAEADAARIEVSRRLIAAADAARQSDRPAPDSPPRRRRAVAVGALVALPVGALAVYLAVGSPDLPGQPLATRAAQAHGGDQSVEAMFAQVEQHLEQYPNDGRGWEVVAPIYMRLGRFDDAVKARRNVLRLVGANAERWSDLGEALVARENGVVTGDAKAAFDTALRLDAKDVPARFYSGLAAEQDGRKDEAVRIWRELIADAPEGAGWIPSVQQALARIDPSAAASPAPSPSTAGPAPQQDDMIRAMVARLAARLQKDGSNVDGWIQLVRSYTVLKEDEKARAAGDDARRALATAPDKLARLEAGLKDLAAHLPVSEPTPAASNAVPIAPAASAAPAGPPQPQEQMIRGMVERLATRLHEDGSDVDGWLRLLRSYMVLGEAEKARAAAVDARSALKNDPDKLRRLDEGARSLGVGG
jgi:cytochrome c-type biogenesis protein CcmH